MNFEIVQLPNLKKMHVKLVQFYIIEPQRPIGGLIYFLLGGDEEHDIDTVILGAIFFNKLAT